MLNMTANWEDTLPSRYRVGSYNRVNSFQDASNILGSSPWFIIKLKTNPASNIIEPWLSKGCSESFKELLVGLANTIINFITRGPKGICI
jgi:hypothetical protein